MPRLAAIIGLIALSSAALAQHDLLGPGQYPQFRTLSGLPGGGFALRPDGSPGFNGALAFSTPIGYSLNNWHVGRAGSVTSDYVWFRFPNLNEQAPHIDSTSKGDLMIGAPLGKFGSFTASVMLISIELDNAFNFQYQLPIHYRNIGISAGVQDISGGRGDRAHDIPGARSSRSFFGSFTIPLPKGIFLSGGYGDRRFEKGFGSISVPIGDRFKVMLEHDGFNFNEGIAWDTRAMRSVKFLRKSEIMMMVGFVRSKYAYYELGTAL
jgi:hypothetical protein